MQVDETFIPFVTGLAVGGMKACPHSGRQTGPGTGTEKVQHNLAVLAAVVPVSFPGELPGKIMFASLVMATRGRPFAVRLGATAAFAVHVVVATTVGVLLIAILPHRAVELAVALTFFAGQRSRSTTGSGAGTTRSRPVLPQPSCGGGAVAGGQGLPRFVNVSVARVITAIVLIILGLYAGWAAPG